jgi:hypothetical protein
VNLCRACGSDFASVSAFARHRVGTHEYTFSEGLGQDPPVEGGRRCIDANEMQGAGMEKDPRGRWCIAADVERARRAFCTRPDRSVCSSGAPPTWELKEQVT